MPAAETGKMSAVEARQMSTIATGLYPVLILYICLVSLADICPVSAEDICPVSTADICPVSTEDICPVSTSHCLCVRQAKGPTHAIAMDLDNRTVTRRTDNAPQDRIAVRFEWALPFGELLKNPNK